jgi:ketosteroid isomerase-like protein
MLQDVLEATISRSFYTGSFETRMMPSMISDQGTNPTSEHLTAARDWFARLSAACLAVDYEAGRRIFADDVASFGTRADIVVGLEHLQRNQWEGIWPNIAEFKADLDSVRGGGSGNTAWGIATWTSSGFDKDGKAFERPGRATVALEHRRTGVAPAGEWLAVHTHFSLNPGTPPRTFGRDGKSR